MHGYWWCFLEETWQIHLPKDPVTGQEYMAAERQAEKQGLCLP